MFYGQYEHALDAKDRVIIPSPITLGASFQLVHWVGLVVRSSSTEFFDRIAPDYLRSPSFWITSL